MSGAEIAGSRRGREQWQEECECELLLLSECSSTRAAQQPVQEGAGSCCAAGQARGADAGQVPGLGWGVWGV